MSAKREQWVILKDGRAVLSFTSMLEMSGTFDSAVAEQALEKGSFATYNRTQYSDVIRAKLAIEGDVPTLQSAQETLKQLKSGTDVFSLVTPDFEHQNLTLESYDFARNVTQGEGLLVVDLRLKEIREVDVQTATTTLAAEQANAAASKPLGEKDVKNASDASTVKTGKTQTAGTTAKTEKATKKRKTMLRSILDAGGK